jgi:predicted anti-sigma-YlaC factor YlaD
MTCEEYREGLSARLDGEDPGVSTAELDRHLAACVACREWLREAERLHRLLRVSAADPVPDLSESIVAAVARSGAPVGPGRAGRLARAGLVAVAGAQGALMIPQLAGHLHVIHEAASWNVAVGAGFLLAALRPAQAAGLLAPIATAVALLYAVTVRDLLGGDVHVEHEVAHLVLLIGVALLMLLRRSDGQPPGRVVTADPVPGVGTSGMHQKAA